MRREARCRRRSPRPCRRRTRGTPGTDGRRTPRARPRAPSSRRRRTTARALARRTRRASPSRRRRRASAPPPPCCRCAARWSRPDCPSRSCADRAGRTACSSTTANDTEPSRYAAATKASEASMRGASEWWKLRRLECARHTILANRHEHDLHSRSARRDAHRRLRLGAAAAADAAARRRARPAVGRGVPLGRFRRCARLRGGRASACRRSRPTIRTSCWSAFAQAIADIVLSANSARRGSRCASPSSRRCRA